MMSPKIFSVLAALVLAVASSTADAGALPTGVCYSPWHHASVSADVIQKDFAQVKTYFSGVRTYHAQFAGVNAIEQAAKAGMKISVGIQMGNAADIGKELDAACVGAKANPASVEAIYVGNENLKNDAFGSFSGAQLCGYITQLRTCIGNPSVKIGTVQRINEWISASDAPAVAAACDVIGVNIYPFFTPGSKSPIEKLKDQWKEINDKFPGGKVHITETGWPRGGAMQVAGNAPSKDTASSFLKDYAQWAKSQPTSYWFMMYDTKGNQPDYENFFGLADTSGVVQLAIPTGDGAATPAQTPAPVAQTPAPVAQTPAPVAQTPAPVAQTPAPVAQTPAPSATKPAENPVAPDATKPAAPAGTKPAENPAKQTDTSGNNNAKTPAPATDTSGNNNAKTPAPAAPVTQSPAGPSVPAATPAATKTSNGKKNKKDCHA